LPNSGFARLDHWIVKLDASGNKTWDKTIGGGDLDVLFSVKQTSDGWYALAGSSHYGISGDKTEVSQGFGSHDYWVVKLDSPCAALAANLATDCNTGGTTVNVNITGIQSTATGTPSWTLTYTVNGVSQTATGTTSTFTLAQNAVPGSVYSLVSITSGTCTNSLSNSLTVQPIPVAPAVVPGSNCGSGSISLSATGAPTGGTYIWYDAAVGGTALYSNTSGTFMTPKLSVATTYYVAVANNAGCEGPRTPVTATIKSLAVNAGVNETICANDSFVQFTSFSPSGGTWSGAGVSASGVFTPNYNLIGNQTLTYTVTHNGCTASATKQVTVKPLPQVSLGSDVVACEGEEIALHSESPSGKYLWSDGSNGPSLKVRQTGIYWVQLSSNGCSSADTIQVTFKTCPTPFIPNIVTLNNDDRNDTFKPQYLPEGKWHLDVYNRWGVKLYESTDYQNNWPNKDITDGTYYYLLKNPATGQQYKGWVEVVH